MLRSADTCAATPSQPPRSGRSDTARSWACPRHGCESPPSCRSLATSLPAHAAHRGWREKDVLDPRFDDFNVGCAEVFEALDQRLDQVLGGRGSGAYADAFGVFQPGWVELGG